MSKGKVSVPLNLTYNTVQSLCQTPKTEKIAVHALIFARK